MHINGVKLGQKICLVFRAMPFETVPDMKTQSMRTNLNLITAAFAGYTENRTIPDIFKVDVEGHRFYFHDDDLLGYGVEDPDAAGSLVTSAKS